MKYTKKFILFASFLASCMQFPMYAQAMPQDNWYLEREFTSSSIGGMKNPTGLSFGPDGKISICEFDKHRVQILDINGTLISTITGTSQPLDSVIAGGKLYVTCHGNRYVKVFDLDGTFLFNLGSYGSGNGQFDRPYGIAADYNGSNLEIFISDPGRNRVLVFSEDGTFLRKFSSINGDPREIAVDENGLLYVGDKSDLVNVFDKTGAIVNTISGISGEPWGVSVYGNRLAVGNSHSEVNKVRIYDINGSFIKEFGSSGDADGQFNNPRSVDYDSSGNLWVTDRANHRIQVFDGDGTFIRAIGSYAESPDLYNPTAFVLDSSGNLIVSDTGNHRVVVFDSKGNFQRLIASSGSNLGKVSSPNGIALGSNNQIYVADTGNDRIQVFDNNGSYIRSFGNNEIFTEPWGVAVSANGLVFVSDKSQNKVHVFDTAGNLTGSWGESGSLNHQLNSPRGIVVGPTGDLFVADYSNFSVKKYSPTGDLLLRIDLTKKGGSSSTHDGSRPISVSVRQDGMIVTSARYGRSDTKFWVFDNLGNKLHEYKYYKSNAGTNGSAVAMNSSGVFCWMLPNDRLFKTFISSYRAGPVGQPDGIPYPALLNVSQAFGSTNLEVSYKVTDGDSPTVTTGMLGFKNGNDSLSSLIVPKTFVGNTAGQLGTNIDVNQSKSVTWDLAADWNGTVGTIAVEILAKDDRDLLDMHFVEIPADSSNSTALTINRFPLTDEDFKSAWYWLLANGDSGIKHERGLVCEPSYDFTPISPSALSGKLLWLDAADINGDGQPNTEANGSKVSLWMDKSDNDFNASQSTVDNQPIYLTDDGKGYPTLSVNNHWMVASNVNFNAKQIFVVTQVHAMTDDYMAVISRGGDKAQLRTYGSNKLYDTGSHSFNASTPRVNGFATRDFATGEIHLLSASLGSNSHNSGNYVNIIIGRDDHNNDRWNGNIYEILVFDRFLSEIENAQMEWYLGQKWGISGPSPMGAGVYAGDGGTTDSGIAYLLNKMNLRVATAAERNRALEATTPGAINEFTPDFRVQPIGNPEKVNEFGIETTRTGTWVVPN